MAHLTKPPVYDIQDSNIALLGSDLEKRVRESAGDAERAWTGAGAAPGLQIWRIEQFKVVEWPQSRKGSFYEGDSYIVLHTYKKTPEAKALSYYLHFWLGKETTQDEAGTAAYKTVELDDHLHGRPVQYREVQSYESPRFLSYFPTFFSLKGGVATGFHHVSSPPPLDTRRLYRISLNSGKSLVVREVVPEVASLVRGDVYVLDKGTEVWQFNSGHSVGREKFRAAEFVRELADGEGRKDCQVIVCDEGGPSAGTFLGCFGDGTTLLRDSPLSDAGAAQPILFRLSDATGSPTFTPLHTVSRSSLSSSDAFILDCTEDPILPAAYVWVGSDASLGERRLAVQYAQQYLYEKGRAAAVPVVKMSEGDESAEFLEALGA
ncbi:hypothetical protein DXG01_004041 [Tephrocybe rancida]|nr:hypothetical protein DXG01_004041 [Tephrocybe rancida]